ncbi:MAG: hypothetical protein ABEI13_01020, partial [Candidatus Paceibacteria bacterium]
KDNTCVDLVDSNGGGEPPKPDAWNYEVKAETERKNFWNPVWSRQPPETELAYTRNIERLYSGQTIRQTVTKVARELKEELENEVEDENIKSHRQDEINILASKIGEVFDLE